MAPSTKRNMFLASKEAAGNRAFKKSSATAAAVMANFTKKIKESMLTKDIVKARGSQSFKLKGNYDKITVKDSWATIEIDEGFSIGELAIEKSAVTIIGGPSNIIEHVSGKHVCLIVYGDIDVQQ